MDASKGETMVPLPNSMNEMQAYGDEHLSLDFQQHVILLDRQKMTLTKKEYELLAMLVENAGEIVPRNVLLMQVWGYGPDIRTRTLDVHVRRLRKKLAPYAERYIETIFGVGYRFQPFQMARFFQPAITRTALAVSA